MWQSVGPHLLPFAAATSERLPMARLLRLSLFQISCGMAAVLLVGTLNRVMIVELKVPAWLVATMVALPLVFAPLRALIGFKSDTYKSVLGWKRVPYLWLGTIIQFGGLAMMPFALLVLSGDTWAEPWTGQLAAAIAFLMTGFGMHMVQTVGLALATDLTPRDQQPNVVAMLSAMQLVGMVLAALVFGALLADFSQLRLIQVVQGAAALTLVLNLVAAWQQEVRDPSRTARTAEHEPTFFEAFRALRQSGPWNRRLLGAGLGTAGFAMQDVLLEPYGGQILGLSVGATTALSALLAGGAVLGFLRAARRLGQGADAHQVAALGGLFGIAGFTLIIFSGAVGLGALFAIGVALIGFGAGLFGHATLTACMAAAPPDQAGLALGVWGAVQATAAGGAIALGGVLRDVISSLALSGALGEGLAQAATGYVSIYLIEIALLFVTLAVVGPLVRKRGIPQTRPATGLAGAAQI
ncbi:BCD family MFS transporter [Falsiroseomonas tokyonensis]|uniref:BCD family MFS transporter n=2 Tax=Falsiroseomonas tokyonensis TaxID=430521 RepID=A0ABV7BZ89_9PROT